MMEAWVACDWELVPTGLKALGNDIEAPVGQVEKGVQAQLQHDSLFHHEFARLFSTII